MFISLFDFFMMSMVMRMRGLPRTAVLPMVSAARLNH